MEKYSLIISSPAEKHIRTLYHANNKSIVKRLKTIFQEFEKKPYTGIGKPESLQFGLSEIWVRHLGDYHKLFYTVQEKTVTILNVLVEENH